MAGDNYNWGTADRRYDLGYPRVPQPLKPKFKTGDIVHLKSGGPAMTVNYIKSQAHGFEIECCWFQPLFASVALDSSANGPRDAHDGPKNWTFAEEALEAAIE